MIAKWGMGEKRKESLPQVRTRWNGPTGRRHIHRGIKIVKTTNSVLIRRKNQNGPREERGG